MIDCVAILAGGFGTRLWPASTADRPKQFMKFSGGLSFLQESVRRAFELRPSGKIVVITRSDLEDTCAEQCLSLAEKFSEADKASFLQKICVLAEPSPRHTAAAVMLATYFAVKTGGGKSQNILVLTSDHVIGPDENFIADCRKAAVAAEAGNLVCFAIPPKDPSTEYGYIKTGQEVSADLPKVYRIENFKEKPSAETAEKYLREGGYWWNSGMFAFSSEHLERGMEELTPEVYEAFADLRAGKIPAPKSFRGIALYESWKTLSEVYEKVPALPLDKALAEKTRHAVAVEASFNWLDVGNWDVFSEISENSAPDNASINSHNNFVYSDIPVALCGVENLVVVIKNGCALIMRKGNSPLVREAASTMDK